jgi:hypothetical protein
MTVEGTIVSKDSLNAHLRREPCGKRWSTTRAGSPGTNSDTAVPVGERAAKTKTKLSASASSPTGLRRLNWTILSSHAFDLGELWIKSGFAG